jgi:Ca2+:H+ antiporter
MINILLIFLPLTLMLEWVKPESHGLIFITSALAIIPLAAWLSHATEHLAEKTGEGVGGLLNATFGNAAELIIALAAMRAGLFDVVKASLVGSIIGNILLVMGASMLAGGLKYHEQKYNAEAARSQATMLSLSMFALVFPSLFHTALGPEPAVLHHNLSFATAVVLITAYLLYLVFQLKTHKKLFVGKEPHDSEQRGPSWSVGKSVLILAVATALIAWMSEVLVGTVEPAAAVFGMNKIFIGVVIVGIIGNAAEHTAAIVAARKNRMDLALSIAIGSSVQITLFVAPLLVFMSYGIAPRPFDLILGINLVLVLFLAILIIGQIAGDGESNWLKGVQLLALYLIFAIAFFFIPPEMIGRP